MKARAPAIHAARISLVIIAVASSQSQAAGPTRAPSAVGVQWNEPRGYRLEATIRPRAVGCGVRGLVEPALVTGCVSGSRAGSFWLPQTEDLGAFYVSPRRTDLARINVGRLPVRVLGRRFLISDFTVHRERVHLTVSTRF